MQKPAIEPIKARSTDPEDVEKYRLLVLVHRMAGSLAVARTGEWWLKETATCPPHHILTTWSNGIVDIEAVTRDGEHTYRLFATPKGDSDETLC